MVNLHNVPAVNLRFAFSNANLFPASWLRSGKQRSPWKGTGELVIKPTPSCSVLGVIADLKEAGYRLADGIYIPIGASENGYSGKSVASFWFTRDVPKPKNKIDGFESALAHLCYTALWQTEVYVNPFYKDGVEVPDQRSVSINLTCRQPLFQPDGKPVMARPRDENGKRIGKDPVPVAPQCQLRIQENAITQVMA